MTLQNRVLPTGEIVADAGRGTLMGNRGILHDDQKQLGTARWRHANWVCCVLSFKGRKRALMAPRRYTELFFLDEAVALAAGHRPCAECRRADFRAFQAAWIAGTGLDAAPQALDRALHAARVMRDRRQVRHMADPRALPDGAFVLHDHAAHLVQDGGLRAFSMNGYGPAIEMPQVAAITVLSPAPVVAALRAGYRPLLHPSAHE